MKITKYLVLALVAFCSFVGHAGIETYSERIEGSGINTTNFFELYEDKHFEMANNPVWFTLFDNYSVRNFVRLGINPAVVQQVNNSGNVDLQIDYETWNTFTSSFDLNTVYQTLSVDFSMNGFDLNDDLSTYIFADAHYIKVSIIAVNGGVDVNQLYLESNIEVERYYTLFNPLIPNLGDQPIPTTTTYSDPANEFIELHWPYHPGAESYELEWVHVNDYTIVNDVYLPSTVLEYNYYLNSTRIEISENFYEVPNIFDHGYFIYRIRPIGRQGVEYKDRLDGEWSAPETGLISIHPQLNVIPIERQYDAGMNWGHQIAYAEGGKRFESVSYVDGLGRGRQTVARNTATDQVVVSNVYYDELGRPVISDLPTPVDVRYPQHNPDFNLVDGGSFPPYQAEFFDLNGTNSNCDLFSTGMATSQGASQYYSSLNPDQSGANAHIPDAEKFPFSRITYKDDFTGRLDRVASAGDALKMGSGRETRLIYETALQSELDQLFGVEVGYYSHYQKLTTIDPNGQAYVQYSDLAGRTVATYMTGAGPANLDALDANNAAQDYTHDLLVNGQGQTVNTSPPSSELIHTRFYGEENATYYFDYNFTPQQYEDLCMISPTCFDCVYDFNITIVGECGDVLVDETQTINGGVLDAACSGVTNWNMIPSPLEVIIPIGVYTVVKTLTVNQDAIDSYWCMYVENLTEACLPPVSDLFNVVYDAEPFVPCNPGFIPALFNGLSDCETREQLMLNDVSPGGQYALYSPFTYTTSDVTSLFHANNLTVWQNATYLDNGTPILVDDGTGNMVSPGALPVDQFIAQFDPIWANALIDFHPESCYLDFCALNSASYAFDEAMMNTYTFADACAAGYLAPLGSFPPAIIPLPWFMSGCTSGPWDPFFDPNLIPTPLGAGYEPSMSNSMTTFVVLDGQPIDIWTYVMGTIMNENASTYNEVIAGAQAFIAWEGRECFMDDLFWVRFRSLYLQLKEQYYQQALDDYAANCTGLPVPPIGSGMGDYGDKIPIFPTTDYILTQLNIASAATNPPGPVITNLTNLTQIQGAVTNYSAVQCANSCATAADEWLLQLTFGCGFVIPSTVADNLKIDFIAMCTNGCDEEHPGGASTPNYADFPNDPTIQEILVNNGISPESTGCTEFLISSPPPYDLTTSMLENLVVPLDTCGCDAIMQAGLDAAGTSMTIEEALFENTGISLDDVDLMKCHCQHLIGYDANLDPLPWSPEMNWMAGSNAYLAGVVPTLEVPADLACNDGAGCTNCDEVGSLITALLIRFDVASLNEFLTLSNSELIVMNYLNQSLNFHLNFTDYIQFINGCSGSELAPYCEINPLALQLNEVLKLVAFQGELVTTSTVDLVQQNIVYANTEELPANGVGQFYSSVQVGNELTMTFDDGFGATCDYVVTIPVTEDFDFADIVSFNSIMPLTGDCDDNFDFQIDVTYVSCGILENAYIMATSSCFEINLCVCGDGGQLLCDDPYLEDESLCYQPILDELYTIALDMYEQNVTDVYNDFYENYNTQCALAFGTENLSYTGPDRYYQYTLFYYDQAGNLVRTVAPQGVNVLPNANSAAVEADRASVVNSGTYNTPTLATALLLPTETMPVHNYETRYDYNSYNQLVSTTNPDQDGATVFWYDRYGRIVASQNPVQAQDNIYSYSLYDAQGRPIQVGQVEQLSALTETIVKADDITSAPFQQWLGGGTRTEITRTRYDLPVSAAVQAKFSNGMQENLRLRVASVYYFKVVTGGFNSFGGYESAIHYSYDIHGNVKEQIQDVPMLAPVDQNEKSTQYEFELISGNVKTVKYQNGELDEMSHEYHYDKLNRLTEVFTSTDDVHKTREAHYRYYDYGPLARVETGQYKVQGSDYAYTINGWLKGMNSSLLDVNHDVGSDGIPGYLSGNAQVHNLFAKDVVSYTMGYFDGDYSAISATSTMEADQAGSLFQGQSPGLFNGNIRNIVTSIYGMTTLGTAYKYDQLQRLKEMTAFYHPGVNNDWTGVGATTEYYNSYEYDRNGNITDLQRNGTVASGLLMDQFEYKYIGLDGLPNLVSTQKSNRLDFVIDSGVDDALSTAGDIKTGMLLGNYVYDELGQLISDLDEEILNIEWRSGDKKMGAIERTGGSNQPDMEFIYNPFGQRVVKLTKPRTLGIPSNQDEWIYTYYSYDANGQVMAVYDVTMETANNTALLLEQNIYGASLLGTKRPNELIYDNGVIPPVTSPIYQNTIGLRYYEIKNHLGNINATITDRKTYAGVGAASLYEAVVTMTADYYPGGFLYPERHINTSSSRRLYNGMEQDMEVSGNGNSYTTEFRQYDPRLMRWKSLDPLMLMFPHMSPYCAFDNNPVYYVDPYGLSSGGPDGEANEGGGAGDKGAKGIDPSFYSSDQYKDKLSAMERSGGITKSDRDNVMKIISERGYAIESDIALLTMQSQSANKEWHRGTARSKNDMQVFVRDNRSYFADEQGGTSVQPYFKFSEPMKEIIPGAHLRPLIPAYSSDNVIGTLPLLPVPQPNIQGVLIPYVPKPQKNPLAQEDLDNALNGGHSTFGFGNVGGSLNLFVNPSSVPGSASGIGRGLAGFSFTSMTFNVTVFMSENNALRNVGPAAQNAAAGNLEGQIRSQIATAAGVPLNKVNVNVNFTTNPHNNSFNATFKP